MSLQAPELRLGTGELSSREAIKASIAEFIATAFFVFVGVGSIVAFLATEGGGGIPLIALAHGLAIALLVAAIGPISGGHINPAVTFAAVITNRITVTRGLMYWVAQLLGALLGAALLQVFIVDDVLNGVPGIGGHGVNDEVVSSNLAALGIEALLTGLLVFTVFGAAVYPKGNTVIAPLAIGFAILVIHLVAIPMTGSGVNPARSFGPMVVFNRWDDFWIYFVGPLLGGGAAGLLYYFLYMMEDERAAAGAGP
ncbi:MAG TPA: MIP family channel protein [Dehalococcoidia bacterium]|nr:MIP family channel protein [Dehalococcoidia bacterium]